MESLFLIHLEYLPLLWSPIREEIGSVPQWKGILLSHGGSNGPPALGGEIIDAAELFENFINTIRSFPTFAHLISSFCLFLNTLNTTWEGIGWNYVQAWFWIEGIIHS